ncbi:MAG: type III pantothenate kinase [Nitrospirae bacterium]|nr:type III pantothenate kinase [Nitrospirota bacterium]
MLLAIDIGNTNVVFGVIRGKEVLDYWRVGTDLHKTAEEYGILFREILRTAGVEPAEVRRGIVSCVVPPILSVFERMLLRYFKVKPLVVDHRFDSGLKILYDNPGEVGADRIVNAVAALELYGGPVIVVDFDTAVTFCAVSAEGEYLGGVITPGIQISLEALFQRASKLPRLTLACPGSVIGKDTVSSMQAGIVFGYAGMVDEIVGRMKVEMDGDPHVVATGGIAEIIAPQTRTIREINPMLTLEGLRILDERNRLT